MPNGTWTWERPDIETYKQQQEASAHPYMAAAVRGGAPLLSAEGGILGALISGGGEAAAQFLEHSADKPYNVTRMLTEGALGAVPMGKIIKAGRVGTSMLRSGALSGVGEAMREGANGDDLNPKKIATATGIGAATGGVGSYLAKLLGFKGLGAAEEPILEGRTTTGNVPKGPQLPSPEAQQGQFQTTSTTFPAPLPRVAGPVPNLEASHPQEPRFDGGKVRPSGGVRKPDVAQDALSRGPMQHGAEIAPTIETPTNSFLMNLVASHPAEGGIINGASVGATHSIPAKGLITEAGALAGPAGDVFPTWAQAAGQAKKLGLPTAIVTPVEGGGYRVGPAPRPTSGGAVSPAPTGTNEIKGLFGGASNGPAEVNDASNVNPIVGTSNKTVPEIKERLGVSTGKLPYNHNANQAVVPISGHMTVNLVGVRGEGLPASIPADSPREGYLFGQHSPNTIIKAEKVGDTIVAPDETPNGKGGFTIGAFGGLGSADSLAGIIKRNPDFALRLATGLTGAGVGAAAGGPDHRMEGALLGGAAGVLAPSLPNVLHTLGVNAEGFTDANLTTKEGLSSTLDKVLHTIPQIQRFNYLASASGLPANALVGPYGAALMGSVEHALAGDPRGMKALQTLKNPATFMQMYGSDWAAKEAERLLTEAHNPELGGERAEDIANKGIRTVTDKLSFPGKLMTRGDVVARKILSDAGFNEQEQRVMTLTAEPYTKLFKGLAHAGQGSAVGQMLFPFRRTPANMGERGLERMPGLGFIAQLRRPDNVPMDSLKQMLIQQGLGAGTGYAGYQIGANTDPDNAKMLRKYLTNAAGMYSVPMAVGLAAGRASQYGQSPLSTGTITGIREALPLPSVQPLMDIVNLARNHTLPRGAVPAFLYDYLKEQH